jgi:sec-independent protein translocase protein TatB
MFGVDSTELVIVAVFALIFIGPKELPTAMRTVGRIVGRVRAHARHFTSGIENMMREAELEEMEKKWRAENERIMTLHPASPGDFRREDEGGANTVGIPDAMPPVADPYADAATDAGPGAPSPSRDFAGGTIDPAVPVEHQVMLPLGLPPAPDESHAHLPPHERPLP